MRKEVAEKWVAALRSGKYKQGRSRLRRDDDTYCCLGVLCDISELVSWENDDRGASYHGALTTLPVEVVKWAELRGPQGECPSLHEYSPYHSPSLVGCNDSLRWTFDEIANFVENHWSEL